MTNQWIFKVSLFISKELVWFEIVQISLKILNRIKINILIVITLILNIIIIDNACNW